MSRAVSWSVVVLYGVAIGGLLAGAEARDVALLLGLAAGVDASRSLRGTDKGK